MICDGGDIEYEGKERAHHSSDNYDTYKQFIWM